MLDFSGEAIGADVTADTYMFLFPFGLGLQLVDKNYENETEENWVKAEEA